MIFKKGDRARVVKNETSTSCYQGMVGVVNGESTYTFCRYEVQFPDGLGVFAGFELEKVE